MILYDAEGTGKGELDVHPLLVQWLWLRVLRRPAGEADAWLLLQTTDPRLATRIVSWCTTPPHVLLADTSDKPLQQSLEMVRNASGDPSPYDPALVEEIVRSIERFEPMWMPVEMEEFRARLAFDRDVEEQRREKEKDRGKEADRKREAAEERERVRQWRVDHPEEAAAQDRERRRKGKQRRRQLGPHRELLEGEEESEGEAEAEGTGETQTAEPDMPQPEGEGERSPEQPPPSVYRGGGKNPKARYQRPPSEESSSGSSLSAEEEEDVETLTEGPPKPGWSAWSRLA